MVIDALYERITFHSCNLHILIKSLELHIILTERLFLDNMDVWHFLRKKHKNQPHETGGDNGETNEDKCTVVQTTTKTKTNSMVQ